MVGRGGSDDSGGDNDVATDKPFAELARHPWTIILIAAITGTGSGTWFARPDPFTGTEGRELEARIASLEAQQRLDDQHRAESRDGYKRIRDNENCCTELRGEIRHIRNGNGQ